MQKFNPDGTNHGQGSWFALADSKNRGSQKVPGFRFDGSGRSFQSASVDHLKLKDQDGYELGWNAPRTSSRSTARKAASAMIAKIPAPLAQWIARAYKTAQEARA
jgi:hypothetical protein